MHYSAFIYLFALLVSYADVPFLLVCTCKQQELCIITSFLLFYFQFKRYERNERVAFIGISNWALDPAKMNRGIMVTRGDPGIPELIESARFDYFN